MWFPKNPSAFLYPLWIREGHLTISDVGYKLKWQISPLHQSITKKLWIIILSLSLIQGFWGSPVAHHYNKLIIMILLICVLCLVLNFLFLFLFLLLNAWIFCQIYNSIQILISWSAFKGIHTKNYLILNNYPCIITA